jgi:hypothetical protein
VTGEEERSESRRSVARKEPMNGFSFWPKDGLPGLLWAFGEDSEGRLVELQGEPLDARLREPDGKFWLHFDLGDNRARRFLEHCSWLSDEARTELLATEPRCLVRTSPNGVVGVLPDLR